MIARPIKSTLRPVHGILLLDKPLAMSSNAALQYVRRRLFAAKKAGHTGSLDPLATGMLPICFGEATKFSQYLLDSDKHYRVTIKLGIKTSTGDAEGDIVETRPVPPITAQQLAMVLNQFKGSITQIPPMFSAVKIQGKPLYQLARRGITVERKSRLVKIHRLDLEELDHTILKLAVFCSKGTYIRTLAEDIGEALGCGAHVAALQRVAVSPYDHAKMYTLEELEVVHKQFGPESLSSYLLPIESCIQTLPIVKLPTAAAFYIRMGQPIKVIHTVTTGLVKLVSIDEMFMGVGEIMEDGRVMPKRLLSNLLNDEMRLGTSCVNACS